MTKIELQKISLLPTGSINEIDPITGGIVRVVYQRVHIDYANIGIIGEYGLQRRKHVVPFDPKTSQQVFQRSKMRLAVIAWQALSAEDKNVWQDKGIDAPLTGYQLYVSAHMQGKI